MFKLKEKEGRKLIFITIVAFWIIILTFYLGRFTVFYQQMLNVPVIEMVPEINCGEK